MASFISTCHGQQLNSLSSRYKMSVVTFKCLHLFLDQRTTKKKHCVTYCVYNITKTDWVIWIFWQLNILHTHIYCKSHTFSLPDKPKQSYAMPQKHMISIAVFMSLLLLLFKTDRWIQISTIQDPAGMVLRDSVFLKISGTTENEKLLSIKVLVLLDWSCMFSRATRSLRGSAEDLLWWRKSENDHGSFE